MSAKWTIKRIRPGALDQTHTLHEWNITGAGINLVSIGRDTLTLAQTKEISEEDDFTNGDTLRLYRDGVQTFMGRVLRPRCNGEAKSEQRVTVVAGPWWWAETTPCIDSWKGNPGQELLPGLSKTRIFIDADGTLRPVGGEIGRLIDSLIATGAPWTKGQIDSRGNPPPRELRNVTFSEVIQTVVQTVPDIVGWFDYSVATPAFHLRDPDLLSAIEIDTSGAAVPASRPRLERLQDIGRHDDDAVSFVEIQIQKKEPISVVIDATGTEEPRYRTDYEKHRYPAAAAGDRGVIVLLEQTDPMKPWDVSGFARRAYEAFKGILWRGEFTMVGDDIDSRLRPGIRVNFTGQRAEWEDMNGLVQEVQHDIFTGRSSAVFGPPLQLSPSDLVQKLIALSVHRPTTNDDLRDQQDGYTAGFDPRKNEGTTGDTERIHALMAVQQGNGTFRTMVVILPDTATAKNP